MLEHYMETMIKFVIVLIFCLSQSMYQCQIVALKQWSSNSSHSSQVISVNIYNDVTKFVSGSNDKTVKIWSMNSYQLLHTQTFTDIVTHISLHPVDNRIFILVFNGVIKVLDPNNFTSLHTGTYPGGGNGNYLRFFNSNSKYIIGGYDTTFPIFHIYNSNTYASIAGGATTDFVSGDQITVTSVNKEESLIVAISSAPSSPIQLKIYNLSTNTIAQNFMDNQALLKWVTFSSVSDILFLASNDMTLKCYQMNTLNYKYTVKYSFSTIDYGYPNCIVSSPASMLQETVIFSANQSIIFLNITGEYPSVQFAHRDQNDIFVMDVSIDGKFLVSGMRNGQITLWQIGQTTTSKQQNILLLIILAAIFSSFIMAVFIFYLISKFCCSKNNQPQGNAGRKGKNKQAKQFNQNTLSNLNQHNNSLNY